MQDQTKAKIFLSSRRALDENENGRSWQHIVPAENPLVVREIFGDILRFNDETLAAGHSTQLVAMEDLNLVILPVQGKLDGEDSEGNHARIEPGQCQCIFLRKGVRFIFTNPYEGALVNFIYICVNGEGLSKKSRRVSFDLANNPDRFNDIFKIKKDSTRFYIGKFSGRQEKIIPMKNHESRLFAFVIEGAWEIQHRLLEGRDALMLWNADQVEIEALSNQAILFLVEQA
jgi:redox-sensitive bicupin YhaK (pirin superfamily)